MYVNELAQQHFDKFFVGFEDRFNTLSTLTKAPEYPRHNIGKTDKGYIVMMALPGWSKEAISVEYYQGALTVKGVKQDVEEPEWIHKGISGKAFDKTIVLDATLEVGKATLVDGMLKVSLHYTPSSKPVTIPVK